MSGVTLDVKEIIVRIIKYLIEGLTVALAAAIIPKNKLTPEEILTIALCASAIFSLLDIASPSIAASARLGSGISIGAGVVGGMPFRPV